MRYPFAPLVEKLEQNKHLVCELLQISGKTYDRLMDVGLDEDQAERYAVRGGMHPFEVWPETRDVSIEAALETVPVCAGRGCSEPLPATATVRRRFCSKLCADRDTKRRWARERYQSDLEFRERRKRASAERYAAERDYVLAQRRRARRLKEGV